MMGVYTDRAIKAKNAYIAAAEKEKLTLGKQKALTATIDHVTNVCTELTSIENSIGKAIEALLQLQGTLHSPPTLVVHC